MDFELENISKYECFVRTVLLYSHLSKKKFLNSLEILAFPGDVEKNAEVSYRSKKADEGSKVEVGKTVSERSKRIQPGKGNSSQGRTTEGRMFY